MHKVGKAEQSQQGRAHGGELLMECYPGINSCSSNGRAAVSVVAGWAILPATAVTKRIRTTETAAVSKTESTSADGAQGAQ